MYSKSTAYRQHTPRVRTQNDKMSSSAEEYTTDEGKRKRSEDTKEEVGQKSKKILRSPRKEESKDAREKQDKEVKGFMKEILSELREIRKEQREYREEIKEIREENHKMQVEMKELKEKLENMEVIEEKMEKIEREWKRNNLILKGLEVANLNEGEMRTKVETMIQHMKVEAKVKKVVRINDRVSKIEVEDFHQKLQILKSKHHLRTFGNGKIYIDSELTTNERKVQSEIREIYENEKKKGNSVKMGYQKVIINGVKYTWDKKKKGVVKSTNAEPEPDQSKN